ncbi:MAG: hypothetical protein J7L19_03705 [Dehalococcoidia bacterium]|nr:hypothetical protein [Dehalococcoidia bacterium]
MSIPAQNPPVSHSIPRVELRAAWQYPFEEKATTDGLFHLFQRGEVTIPMMKQKKFLTYAESEGCQTVELPYDSHELSMIILLPQAGHRGIFQMPQCPAGRCYY